MTKLSRYWIVAFGFFIAVSLYFLVSLYLFLTTPAVIEKSGVKYTVVSGSSIKTVSKDLYSLNIIQHPNLFRFFVYLKGNKHALKSGEYLFQAGATPLKIWKQISTGTGMVYYSFTIIEGWNFKQLRHALFLNDNLHHVSAALPENKIMAKLGYPNLAPEGRFFPDTYHFVKGFSDLSLLKMAFDTMQHKLNYLWETRDSELPFQSPQEALIAASLIEKEAYLLKEKPIIAGVIINRLKKNMLLQFDPTVIYAMGGLYNGKLTKTDLLFDNPYNTYVYKGLPPAPISMPGLYSLEAVMHPQKHKFYYFVAKGDGSHDFSESLKEHSVAISRAKKYHGMFFNFKLTEYYFLKTNSLLVMN